MSEHLCVTTLLAAHPDLCPPIFTVSIHRKITAAFSGSQIIFGSTSDHQDVVLKGSAYSQGLSREWAGLQALHQQPLAVQVPLAVVADPQGSRFLMTQWVKGQSLVEMTEDGVRHRVGELVKNIHDQVNISGAEWQHSSKSQFTYYDRYLAYWQRHQVPHLEAESRPVQLLRVLARPMIDHLAQVQPHFTHQDVHDGQIIVEANAQPVLLDFEWWQEDDPLVDLAMYLFHTLRMAQPLAYVRELYQGYQADQELPESDRDSIAFYLLFIAARAVASFRQLQSAYLPVAEQNLQTITAFIDQEKPWREL